MGYNRFWDIKTLFFYIWFFIFIALLFKISMNIKNKNQYVVISNNVKLNAEKIIYFFIFFISCIFLCFRVVQGEIGGTDTKAYINMFENIEFPVFKIENIINMKGIEYLFLLLLFITNQICTDYHFLFFIIYGIIISAYITFVDKNIRNKSGWFILSLIALPILQSMNILRNSLAIAISIYAILNLKNGKVIKYTVLSVLAFLTHYISIIILAFGIFFHFMKKMKNNRKLHFFIVIMACIVGVLSISFIKRFISNSGFSGYADTENSIKGFLPIYILFLLCYLFFDDLYKKLKKDNIEIYYYMLLFNIIITTISIPIGAASRTNLFFESGRMLLWYELYLIILEKNVKKDRMVYFLTKLLAITLVLLWIIFRIYRMWFGYGIMPYYNELFM